MGVGRERVMTAMTRRTVLLALVASALAGCAAGASAPAPATGIGTGTAEPRLITQDEANRLSTIRFSNYRAGTLAVSGAVVQAQTAISVSGWLDMKRHRGYAMIAPDGGGTPFFALWSDSQVAARNADGQLAPPLPPPADGWDLTTLSAQTSTLAAGQLLLLQLAADRPENPQLLISNRAQWVRSDTLGGVQVDVFDGPLGVGATVSNIRYWVDPTDRLVRVEARLDGRSWSRFDLAPASGISF